MLLEVIATTVEDAVAAEAGGADRLEIVRDLDRGGLTPPLAIVETMLARARVPLRVMVRVEEPFCPTSPSVLVRMCEEARAFAALPLDGLVLGVLDAAGGVDAAALAALVEAAAPLPVTFHRAFDEARDHEAALRTLATVPQVDRVLTSVGTGTPADRLALLRRWNAVAGGRPRLLVAASLDTAFARTVAAAGFELHTGRAVRDGQRVDGAVRAEAVAAIRRSWSTGA